MSVTNYLRLWGQAVRRMPTVTEAQWDEMLAANLKAAFLCCKHVVPQMLSQGRGDIVNIASTSGTTKCGRSVSMTARNAAPSSIEITCDRSATCIAGASAYASTAITSTP